ncbi:MAG: hypothetical protein ACXWTG_12720, partial [Methylosarcina sp.]
MMSSRLKAIGIHIAAAALSILPPATDAASFNYLYIEASEGNSSGGHAAIQFDEDIYHFQHVDSGLIRLFKQEKDAFHFLYRYLLNRPMHLSRVDVSEETLDLLKDQFKWRFLTQERQFKLLDDLNKDRIFLRYLMQKLTPDRPVNESEAASRLRLKGVGLFYPEPGVQPQHTNGPLAKQQSSSIQRLRRKVEQRYGEDFLPRLRERIESQIKSLAPNDGSGIHLNLAEEKFPASFYPFAEKYSDFLTALFAIRVLREAPPLQFDALLLPNQPVFKISEAERRELQALRNVLETRLIKAFDSNRPDWGYAVLVTLVRYIAIDASLRSGFWVFIDDFAEDSERVRPEQYLNHKARLRILMSDAKAA